MVDTTLTKNSSSHYLMSFRGYPCHPNLLLLMPPLLLLARFRFLLPASTSQRLRIYRYKTIYLFTIRVVVLKDSNLSELTAYFAMF